MSRPNLPALATHSQHVRGVTDDGGNGDGDGAFASAQIMNLEHKVSIGIVYLKW